MKVTIGLAVGFALGAGAVPFEAVRIPVVDRIDTEVTTNVSITAWQLRAAKFSFSLSSLATPSNNVEAAFGTDTNGVGASASRSSRSVLTLAAWGGARGGTFSFEALNRDRLRPVGGGTFPETGERVLAPDETYSCIYSR